MNAAWFFGLLAAGVAAGVVGTVVSLASVVSYPVLLAFGLPPLSANVTNTVALLFSGAGAAAGSRVELSGQGGRIRRLGLVAALGGGAGAALLLLLPPRAFEYAAPVLIAASSLALLAWPGRPKPGPRSAVDPRSPQEQAGAGERRWPLLVALFGVAGYIGYFGAAGGIMALAVLSAMIDQSLARNNALKNVIGGLANSVAAVAFAWFAPVRWAAVLPLGAGFLIGGWAGSALVRRLPTRPLRIVVALCGGAVAVKLAAGTYR